MKALLVCLMLVSFSSFFDDVMRIFGFDKTELVSDDPTPIGHHKPPHGHGR